jgi:type VI secretion system protein ImpA
VQTRAEAVELLKAVESFYKSAEPSSPIPVLIERAYSLTSKDFFSLMAEFSPPEST